MWNFGQTNRQTDKCIIKKTGRQIVGLCMEVLSEVFLFCLLAFPNFIFFFGVTSVASLRRVKH